MPAMLPANPRGIYNQAGSEDFSSLGAHIACGETASAAAVLRFSEKRLNC
jgi:hypothetical protein